MVKKIKHKQTITQHRCNLGDSAGTSVDKWLSLLTLLVCLQWLTDKIDQLWPMLINQTTRTRKNQSFLSLSCKRQSTTLTDYYRLCSLNRNSKVLHVNSVYLWRGVKYTWTKLVRRSSPSAPTLFKRLHPHTANGPTLEWLADRHSKRTASPRALTAATQG